MPFLLATTAANTTDAKNQAKKAQATAYKHDVAWSVYTQSAATAAWIKAYAKNARFTIFLSTPELLPSAPAFSGQNAGYNAGLALGFLFDQPAILLADADLTANAINNISALKEADAIQGACTSRVDEPESWQTTLRQILQSASAGVTRTEFAALQLKSALDGTLLAEYPNSCHRGLTVNAHAITNACLPPESPAPFDVYANEAFRFGVHVLQAEFAWTLHPEGETHDANLLEKTWTNREQNNAYMRALDYVLDKKPTLAASDFVIDEALKTTYYESEAAITEAQYRQILALREPNLSLTYARLTRRPTLPNKAETKHAIKTHLLAQTSWKETLRAAGEQNLEEKLRL